MFNNYNVDGEPDFTKNVFNVLNGVNVRASKDDSNVNRNK